MTNDKNGSSLLSAETAEVILGILRRGNTAELKREHGKLVVVEIQRKMKTKTSING